MSSGSVLPLFAVQIGAFLVPIAAGLAGWVSGAVAGFAAVTSWFAVGLPLSYALADWRAARMLRRQAGQPLPAAVDVLSPVVGLLINCTGAVLKDGIPRIVS